ncbi:MAG: Fic family protein [Candidatus Eisenbacteria bacterium]|nr:Fic family protein [Candidatus Eisenbacteria bacterium]
MKRGPSGRWEESVVGGESVRSFVPRPLPPDPPLQLSRPLHRLLEGALISLGRLDALTTLLPDPAFFLYTYVRKEAVLSSQIEGTQSSLSDLLLFEFDEAPGVPRDDAQEVSLYVAALEHGLKRLNEGFPLSNRLIREIHGVLLSRGRGSASDPGEFRRSANWIGGSRPGNATFVPPPPQLVAESMGFLEKYLHEETDAPPILLKAALAHVQFETIHPFLDGNGRVGRLLITLVLCAEGVLRQPLLYLSLFFKQNRKGYYDFLQRVREEGTWEEWIEFFLTGVRETADAAVATAQKLTEIFDEDRKTIQSRGRAAGSALRVQEVLKTRPVTSVERAVRETGLTAPTVNASLRLLESLGLVRELTGKKRNRLFGYGRYLDLLNEGTENP